MEKLMEQINMLHEKYILSQNLPENYFEPGNMEYLNCYNGYYDQETKEIIIRFEVRGTRYNGRTEHIEKLTIGDELSVKRDFYNEYNSNNFVFEFMNKYDVGVMPAELANTIAPLYDKGLLTISSSKVSFVEPISKRSRYAKQAVLFVELILKLL